MHSLESGASFIDHLVALGVESDTPTSCVRVLAQHSPILMYTLTNALPSLRRLVDQEAAGRPGTATLCDNARNVLERAWELVQLHTQITHRDLADQNRYVDDGAEKRLARVPCRHRHEV